MASKSYKQAIRNPEIRRWFSDNVAFKGLTATAATITRSRLVEKYLNTVRKGSEQSAAILGVTRKDVAASAGSVEVEFGCVPVYLASPVTITDILSARADGMVAKQMASQVTLLTATAGGSFGNQPAGDAIEVLSDSAADIGMTVTIYGTITGTTGSVTSETVTLNGTTIVTTTITTWQNILGVSISAAHAGTVTVQEASGNADVITIATGTLTAGIETPSTTNGYGLILRHDASDTSSAPVGIIGTGVDGAALSVVDTLNGTTEEDHGTTAFATVSTILLGAVASTVNTTILTNETVDSTSVGMALETSAVAGVVKDCYIKPYWF